MTSDTRLRHRAYEARRQLALDLLRRQLSKYPPQYILAALFDQHVDATRTGPDGPHGRLGIGAAGDVQLERPAARF